MAKNIASTLAMPEVRAALADIGATPFDMTQADFPTFVLKEIEGAKTVVKATGMVQK